MPASSPHPDTARRKRRALYLLAALSLTVVLIVSAMGLRYLVFVRTPALEPAESVTFVIPSGSSWATISEILTAHDLARPGWPLEVWARSRDLPRHVKAGTYALAGPMTLDELDAILRQGGRRDSARVTIYEGWTIFHIAERLEALQVCSRKAFLDAARDPALLHEHDVPGESFEGYLFPDTYEMERGTSAEDIVVRLHTKWADEWAKLEQARPGAIERMKTQYGLSAHDVVTLASIVVKETNHDPERPTVARVFLNRIQRGMKLQTDPTCVYGEETFRDVPSPGACKDKLNRYSTYVIEGLPPGPISNPGRASLEAALSPDPGKDAGEYLFFVAKRDGTGAHFFSKTYKEHKRAIDRYLR